MRRIAGRGRPWVLPTAGLVIQSGGPLAAGAAHRGGRNAVKVRECAAAQGSQVEDRGWAPTELTARFSAATRT